jgi:hypothetical protein
MVLMTAVLLLKPTDAPKPTRFRNSESSQEGPFRGCKCRPPPVHRFALSHPRLWPSLLSKRSSRTLSAPTRIQFDCLHLTSPTPYAAREIHPCKSPVVALRGPDDCDVADDSNRVTEVPPKSPVRDLVGRRPVRNISGVDRGPRRVQVADDGLRPDFSIIKDTDGEADAAFGSGLAQGVSCLRRRVLERGQAMYPCRKRRLRGCSRGVGGDRAREGGRSPPKGEAWGGAHLEPFPAAAHLPGEVDQISHRHGTRPR